jgi:hypothetical protein
MFDRAETRNTARKESSRSDWLFRRARDRKRFHRMAEAEWHTKRLFNKDCSSSGEREEDEDECEDIGQVR